MVIALRLETAAVSTIVVATKEFQNGKNELVWQVDEVGCSFHRDCLGRLSVIGCWQNLHLVSVERRHGTRGSEVVEGGVDLAVGSRMRRIRASRMPVEKIAVVEANDFWDMRAADRLAFVVQVAGRSSKKQTLS